MQPQQVMQLYFISISVSKTAFNIYSCIARSFCSLMSNKLFGWLLLIREPQRKASDLYLKSAYYTQSRKQAPFGYPINKWEDWLILVICSETLKTRSTWLGTISQRQLSKKRIILPSKYRTGSTKSFLVCFIRFYSLPCPEVQGRLQQVKLQR